MNRIYFALLFFFFSFINIGTSSIQLINSDTLGPEIKLLPDTSDLTFNLLRVPASPAFTLMGIAPTVIDEPKTPGDFVLSLNNATNDFTQLPKSYAIEFAPAWVFGKRNIDFSQVISNNIGQNLKQSFTVSFGINPVDNPMLAPGNLEVTQIGIGLKASLLRGKVGSTFEAIDSMYHVLAEVNDSFYVNLPKWLRTDTQYRTLEDSLNAVRGRIATDPSLAPRLGEIVAQLNTRSADLLQDTVRFQQEVTNRFANQLTLLKNKGQQLKFIRRGFKLDIAGGFVTDFNGQSFARDSANVTKIGAWLTGGWTFGKDNASNTSSILGVARLIGNPDQLFRAGDSLDIADNLFFDFGSRLIFHNGDRLSVSGEVIGRFPINSSNLQSTSRYTLNFEYQFNQTIVLTLNIGKDFNGVITKEGNLLTALHLFSYFGKRSYNNDGNPSL